MADIVRIIKNFPPIKSLVKKRGLDHFLSARGYGSHYGRFNSFAEAREWLPPSREFNFRDFSNEYVDERSSRIYSFDYPVLFWLRKAFDEGSSSIYDIGGSVGNQYYAYSKFLTYPQSLKWIVSELPAFVKIGRELALTRNATLLSFTDNLDVSGVDFDIWIAAGAIEFIESVRLERLLEQSARRPRHLLLNKLPLYDGEDGVSTQNIGNGSFVPHYIFNRLRFVEAIEKVGYRLVDSWSVPDRAYHVPGQPENSFDEYSGLYFAAR